MEEIELSERDLFGTKSISWKRIFLISMESFGRNTSVTLIMKKQRRLHKIKISVTATDFDRDLAAKHDFVRIEGKRLFIRKLDCWWKRDHLGYDTL